MSRCFGLIPAAGRGTRMGTPRPKQYDKLGAHTMLEHAVDALLAEPRVHSVLVVIAPGDEWHRECAFGARVQVAAVGGATRADSVHAGLQVLSESCGASDGDWVLVHDAARPCLAADDVARLMAVALSDPVGALLAQPLADTLKRADGDDRVVATVPRAHAWRAATPQMFPLGVLRAALADPDLRQTVTDEAAALEAHGKLPRLVECAPTNIKVTRPADRALAMAILQMQGRLA